MNSPGQKLSTSASSPQVLDSRLKASTREFIHTEYRESYPFRNPYEARHGLRRRKAPTTDFIKNFSQAPLKEPRLYELKVNHGYSMRARSAKAAEKLAAKAEEKKRELKQASRKARELTAAEQMKQLCDDMKNSWKHECVERPVSPTRKQRGGL
eukprot:TRINITY_DN11070_c0_g1_i1.p1 TRINITY_DN11070_c0_g1~~TRINITY_DN11070_c0_g1_i1.p1  ORF type:complete len:154 (-),score=23.23 TRINITY_DN11070_c0_g1_i1:281-742(-)